MESRASPAQLDRIMIRRLTQLLIGLWLYGAALALFVRADLGLDPWNVFHAGVAGRTGLSLGAVMVMTGVLVLLAWWPLRQRPGIGTLANILIIGLAVDVTLPWLPILEDPGVRGAALVASLILNGLAGALYIGAGLGPGPRDGLMTGIAARTGASLRVVRTIIELTVLAAGWALGGAVGIGTVVYALAIGPLVQAFLPWVHVGKPAAVNP
jgi:uncharacterized membrane protein YczE